jgi:hypothetical protein
MYRQRDGRIDRWINDWEEGQTDGWTDGRKERDIETDGQRDRLEGEGQMGRLCFFCKWQRSRAIAIVYFNLIQ